jgi:signal transduction histidine kinase
LALERAGPDGRVRIAIRDRGIGIPADRLPHIFERFEWATSTRHYGGLGLGLFIARQIAQAHGGTISVESELVVDRRSRSSCRSSLRRARHGESRACLMKAPRRWGAQALEIRRCTQSGILTVTF